VEAAGIEPASEDLHLKLSTSVDCVLSSPGPHARSQACGGVASYFTNQTAKLKFNSFTAGVTPETGAAVLCRPDGSGLKPLLLIYYR